MIAGARKRSVSIGAGIGRIALVAVALMAAHGRAWAQAELLPLDHPATLALVRIYEYGAIPAFPREHLPISRGEAERYLAEAAAMTDLPPELRDEARHYLAELVADRSDAATKVVIPTSADQPTLWSEPLADRPLAILTYRDTTVPFRFTVEPILDGELRVDPDGGAKAFLAQGGVEMRGTVLNHVGIGARFTNGTIAGDSLLALRDLRISHSGKIGVLGQGHDIDFGSAHFRLDFGALAAEIGRERVALGGGVEESLLLGSTLPSNFDYLRLTGRFGRVSFTHIHAALLAEPNGVPAGWNADIPTKFLAAHLLSIGPFAGIRLSLGESVIYGRRPFEIGYLNPLNFLKSQEHYLRDRDNANMYAALSVNPVRGIFLEGEYLLDDLKFSEIGNGFWSNKSAWRVGAKAVAVPYGGLDIGLSYTHVEPYTYSHFDETHTNEYTHDGVILSGGDVEPNSYMIRGELRASPLAGFWIRGSLGVGEHGANVVAHRPGQPDSLILNVGGDYRQTFRSAIDSPTVDFLGGVIEKKLVARLEAEYELIRSVYARGIFLINRRESGEQTTSDSEVWIGLRIGAH